MTHFLSLFADPARPVVDLAVANDVRSAIKADAELIWLADRIALELPVVLPDAATRADAERRAREAVGDLPIDLAILPAANRAKKLLIADMDSTIIGQECIDELADYAGHRAEISEITERAMLGDMPFEEALRQRVALLRGVPITAIGEILADRISISPGAKVLVKTMRARGAYTALVSGGFTGFTGPVASAVGFHEDFANGLERDGDVLTGRVVPPVRGAAAKLQALEDLSARLGIAASDAIAVGDGANDVAVIEAAGLGVAFHAKPAVALAADVRIDHGDLTALLHIQGYRTSEFAT